MRNGFAKEDGNLCPTTSERFLNIFMVAFADR